MAKPSVTTEAGKYYWVKYLDYIEAARWQVEKFQAEGVEIIIAMTHLPIGQDIELSKQVPGIDLIMGGHEHEHNYVYDVQKMNVPPVAKREQNEASIGMHAPVAKADENAA